jgi:Lon protease-like protein
VHFPGTRLPLHVFELRYRSLVTDLLSRPADERRIGMILTAPLEEGAEPALLEPGCAGLMVRHEPLPDGRSNLLLEGQFRFRVERELGGHPYRMAEVDSLPDEVPLIEDEASGELQREIVELASGVARLSGDRSPIDLGDLAGLAAEGRLTTLVNRIAAGLDVPPLRKQSLLALGPLDRAREVAGILRSRVRLLDTLRPYRRFAEDPSLN